MRCLLKIESGADDGDASQRACGYEKTVHVMRDLISTIGPVDTRRNFSSSFSPSHQVDPMFRNKCAVPSSMCINCPGYTVSAHVDSIHSNTSEPWPGEREKAWAEDSGFVAT